MAVYEYRCVECDVHFVDEKHLSSHDLVDVVHWCENGKKGQIVRVFSFSFHRPLQPHYNVGLGKYVAGKRQLQDELRRQSEERTERTNISHDFQYADLRDRDIFPVTHDGLQSTYDAHDPSSPVRRAIEKVK